MNLKKFTFIGAIALVSAFAINAHAGECKVNIQDTVGAFSVEQSNGKFIDGDLCVKAITQGFKTFDSTIDKVINNKLVSAEFDSMNNNAKTNSEAKKLQDMYRAERANFVNDYLVKTNQDSLPTKSDGKRHISGATEKMDSYLTETNPFNSDKVTELREKFTSQAKSAIKNSL